MASPNRFLLPALTLLLLGLALALFLKGRRTAGPSGGSVPAAHSSVPPAAPPGRVEHASRLGLSRQLLRWDESHFFLDLYVLPKRGCDVGDLDAIKLELDHSDVKRLLLTVESLSSLAASPPLVREVTLEELQRGFAHTFPFPRVAFGQPYGLFLCKDSGKQGHCSQKEFVDYNKLFGLYGAEVLKPVTEKASDKIYYFQFLNVATDGAAEFFDSPRPPQKTYDSLPQYLAGQKVPGGPQALRDAVSRVKQLSGTLVSLPLQTGANVRVDLPAYDELACRRRAAEREKEK